MRIQRAAIGRGMDEKRSKPLLVVVAALFLFESWVWQGCVALGRWIVARVPWTPLKARIAAFIAILPAPAALAVFLIPVAIIEPLKVVCFALIARHHIALGILGFIALKFIGLGLIAVTFDLTKEKLLTMAWFAWVYRHVVRFNGFAHALIAPYKAIVAARARALGDWAQALWRRSGYGADWSG
jgi:hypothetical protein